MASSFSSNGSTVSNPRAPLSTNSFGSPTQGVVGTLNKGLGFQSGSTSSTPNFSSAAGLLQSSPQGGYTPTTPQKGLLDTHTPTTPVKSITDATGNKVDFHAPDTSTTGTTQQNNSATATGATAPTTPQVGTTQQNAQNVLNAGQFTPFSSQAIQDIGTARQMQNFGQLGGNAESQFYAGLNPSNPADAAKIAGLMNRPDLVGRAGGESGLYGGLSNIFGSTSAAELQAAEGQAGRALDASKNVLSASIPGQLPPTGASLYNPLTGDTVGNGGGSTGIVKGAAAQALPGYYNDMTTAGATLQNIQDNTDLFNKLIPSTVNISDATPLNELANKVGSLFSNEDYAKFNALIPNIVSQYASYIGSSKGLSPTDSFNQASKEINTNSSIGTIKSVLGILSQEANNTLNAKKSQYNSALQTFQSGNIENGGNSSNSTGGSYTSNSGHSYTLPY